jgi:hypothetical protein
VKILLDNATVRVEAAPGIRILTITTPEYPTLELGIVIGSLDAAVAARALMQGDPDPDAVPVRAGDPITIAR